MAIFLLDFIMIYLWLISPPNGYNKFESVLEGVKVNTAISKSTPSPRSDIDDIEYSLNIYLAADTYNYNTVTLELVKAQNLRMLAVLDKEGKMWDSAHISETYKFENKSELGIVTTNNSVISGEYLELKDSDVKILNSNEALVLIYRTSYRHPIVFEVVKKNGKWLLYDFHVGELFWEAGKFEK